MNDIVHDTPRAATSAQPDAASEKPYAPPPYTLNDSDPYERGVTRLRLIQSVLETMCDAHGFVGIQQADFDQIQFGLKLVIDDAHRDFYLSRLAGA